MKVLLVNTEDSGSGASRSAYRLYQGLSAIGIEPQMLVQTKYTGDFGIIGSQSKSGLGKIFSGARLTLDSIPPKLYPHREKTTFSSQWVPSLIHHKIAEYQADIVNLHWINYGYISIENIAKFKQPVVWTLHDMWAFTGGCHYNLDCNFYKSFCGNCPQLGSGQSWDLSRWIWHRKSKAWKNLNLTLVTPSFWLKKCAEESSLFRKKRVEVIPNGLDIDTYRPINKKLARKLLQLPLNKQLVLFLSLQATSDYRKGYHLLQPALQKLSYQANWKENLELIVVGALKPQKKAEFGFKAHYLGLMNDDLNLALAYSAADVCVAPSIQDNLPNSVLEAIACGTPCVAFNIGGMSDMIEHQKNGYLAQPYEIIDLAEGIAWVMNNQERHQRLSYRAREKTEQEFTLNIQAQRYLKLFNEIAA